MEFIHKRISLGHRERGIPTAWRTDRSVDQAEQKNHLGADGVQCGGTAVRADYGAVRTRLAHGKRSPHGMGVRVNMSNVQWDVRMRRIRQLEAGV